MVFVRQAISPVGGLFVLKVRRILNADHAERIRAAWAGAWKMAGRDLPPALLILDGETELEALGSAQLADAGLMKVPA